MILIFGGAYQGKLSYALERFGLTEDDVGRCSCEDAAHPQSKKIVCGVEKWILALIQAERNVADEVKRFMEENKDSIVICNDISCGVVPVDPIMRRWRDEVGKAIGLLARSCDEVIRLYCGIPTKLK